jgi:hypothetical protein
MKHTLAQNPTTPPSLLFGIARDVLASIVSPDDDGAEVETLASVKVAKEAIVTYVTTLEQSSEVIYRSVLGLRCACEDPPYLRKHYDEIVASLADARKNVNVRFRILASQHILNGTFPDHESDSSLLEAVGSSLAMVFENVRFPKKTRADAVDVFMSNFSSSDNARLLAQYQRAEETIAKLGKMDGDGRRGLAHNVYNDGQNVHKVLTSNSQSFLEIVHWLRKNHPPVRWSMKRILEFCLFDVHGSTDRDAIRGSIGRIEMDSQVHHPVLRVTDIEVLRRIIAYANRGGVRDQDVCLRLAEELVDSDGWCSSGHIARLINVMSGREGLHLLVPSTEAIYAKLTVLLSSFLENCHKPPEDTEAETMLRAFSRNLSASDRAQLWKTAYGKYESLETFQEVSGDSKELLPEEVVACIVEEWGEVISPRISPTEAFLFVLRSVGRKAFEEYFAEDPPHRRNLTTILTLFATTFHVSLETEFGNDIDFAGSMRFAFARMGL